MHIDPNHINLQRIHVIYKTHLDVGFTDFSANVIRNYFQAYIPKAIDLARELRESGSSDRFVWTTGSWLIYEYLEQANSIERNRMEEAIAAGDITWHALPFTTHSENMDSSLFRFGLSLSQELDRRFDKQTIAAKMTDVPGHTRGIVPLLAEAGIQFLHIGVNGASTPPDVPPVFLWQIPGGAQIIVMYHKGSYGDLMVVPGMQDAIAFAHTGDNLGPQSTDQIQAGYQEMRKQFPQSKIFASTMDAFARQLMMVRDTLPVITGEIGDTWIHGAGTDPKKESMYRELSRLRRNWLAMGEPESSLHGFSRKLMMIPEHTWGLDLKTHLNDWENYAPVDFQVARSQPNFIKMEQSWEEQRDYLRQAIQSLPDSLQAEAKQKLARLEPHLPDVQAYQKVDDYERPINLGKFVVSVDPQTGCLRHLEMHHLDLAGDDHPIGLFWYEVFSAEDYRRFYRQYCVNKRQTRFWSIPDFTKPGIDPYAPEHKTYLPGLKWMGIQERQIDDLLLLHLEMPPESTSHHGAPKHIWLQIVFSRQEPVASFRLQWFEKKAFRLPEALWFSFNPRVKHHRLWRMNKLGHWISPYEVIRNGNRHLHAVGDEGVFHQNSGQKVQIQSLDSVLVAPGEPSLLDFNNQHPNLRNGLHFNLFNNLWGTNFPMWYEENALFRFLLSA